MQHVPRRICFDLSYPCNGRITVRNIIEKLIQLLNPRNNVCDCVCFNIFIGFGVKDAVFKVSLPWLVGKIFVSLIYFDHIDYILI